MSKKKKPVMGRPPIPEQHRRATLTVSLPRPLIARIKASAEAEGKSVSFLVETALAKAYPG